MSILNFLSCDKDLLIIYKLLINVADMVKIFVPILLILFGTIDLAKAVIAGKEDEMKKAQGTLIKRFIYAVAVFLVVNLVMFILRFAASSGVEHTNDWRTCYDEAINSK